MTCEFRNITSDGSELYHIVGDPHILLKAAGLNPAIDHLKEDQLDNLVTKIAFKSSTVTKIPNLMFQRFQKLQVFDGSAIGLHKLTTLSFNGAGNLIAILLHNNHLTTIIDYSFVHSKNLKNLDLSNNKITEIRTNAFSSLRNLEELSLSNNKMKTLDGQIFRHLPQLRWIWLDRNQLNTIPTTLFLKSSERLHGIFLNNNGIVKISPYVFNNLPKLRFLMLSGNSCTDRNFKNHVIQDNISVQQEMHECYHNYRKDDQLMEKDEVYNITKSVIRLEDAIISCVLEKKEIQKSNFDALNQIIQWLKKSQELRSETEK